MDTNGNPDWDWIEQYMKSLEEGLDDQMNDIIEAADGDKNIIKVFADKVEIDDFKAWLQDNANMDADNQMSLADVKWKEFKLSDVFVIKKVYGRKISDYEKGNIPYVSGTQENNGITGWVDALKTDISEGNCITVDPITATSTYQPNNFVGRGFSGASINLLYNDNLNKEKAAFIITAIQQNTIKYSYARLLNGDKLANLMLYLPVDTNGNPDWNWIEQYMKSLPYSDKEVEVA